MKRLSNFAQIESLWRFNAKYEPEWLPRYVVFDTAEHLVPVVMAILRAESVWEIPVLGKLLAAGAEKRMLAAQRETEEFIASFGSLDEEDDHHGEGSEGVDGRAPGPVAGPVAGSPAPRPVPDALATADPVPAGPVPAESVPAGPEPTGAAPASGHHDPEALAPVVSSTPGPIP